MVPQEELPILEALVNLKHRLGALKKDTTTFIRAKDVMSIYQSVAKEVTKLNTIRDRQAQRSILSSTSNAVDNTSLNLDVAGRALSRSNSGSARGGESGRPNMRDRNFSGISGISANSSNAVADEDNYEDDDGYTATEAESSTAASSRSPSGFNTPNDEPENHSFDLHSRPHPRHHSAGPSGTSPTKSPLLTPVTEAPEEDIIVADLDEQENQQPTIPDVEAPSVHLATIHVEPPAESNRVDQVLNDVFNLLSLFFLTIGKVRESPGTFCQIASMRQFLDHMNESGVYTNQDLQPFAQRLAVLRMIIKRDTEEGKHPDAIIKLMMKKLEDTERLLQTLLKSLSILSVELVPIHQRLVYLRRQLSAVAAQMKPTKNDIKPIVEELRKIDSSRVDGKFLGPGGGSVPTGQAILVGLLEECFDICQDVRAREGEHSVAITLKPIWERLTDMRSKLERLQLTHRWTLRETDLYNYSQALREVDSMRQDGSFVDSDGNKAEGQYVLLYLLRRCHGLIYRLIAESEPISEELMPIANKLSTVKKCLNEVLKYGGPFSARELYPYHLALHQIDTLRVDGKFLSEDGSIPEGQAILVAQLAEAHEILEMLKEGMGDDDDDEDDDSDDDDDEDKSSEEDDEEDAEHGAEGIKKVDGVEGVGLKKTSERYYKTEVQANAAGQNLRPVLGHQVEQVTEGMAVTDLGETK